MVSTIIKFPIIAGKRTLSVLLLIIFCGFQLSCKKFIETEGPITSLSEKNVYNNDVSAISVLTGLYQQLNQDQVFGGTNSISILSGLSSDELTLFNGVSSYDAKFYYHLDSLYSNSIGSVGAIHWTAFYNYIAECNAAIEGLQKSISLSDSVRQQLVGEAKFMRAFFYFYLVNLYGDVPLVLTTAWQINSGLARNNKSNIYEQIISDLKDAQSLMSDKFLNGSLQPYAVIAERVRPTKWAAIALLSRVYLYNGDWANAASEATMLINNTMLFNLPSLNDAFKKNSAEAIWQLQPINTGQNTSDGLIFIMPSGPDDYQHTVYLSSQLVKSFETGDKRRYFGNWIDSTIVGSDSFYYPFKYKVEFDFNINSLSDLTEYLMIMRLGEQFIIRAEARAHLNDIGGAQSDLNRIRSRAGLPNTSANDQASLLSAIMHERQVELFSEWGHRWLDLKRTGNINTVMSAARPLKANGASWQPWMALYPIPFEDIKKDPILIQNPGY